jgi:hypothetical protein
MRILWRAQAVAWFALLSFNASSFAASISLAPLDNDPSHAIVLVEGDLLPSDDAAFRAHVGRLTKAIVGFKSDGGNLLAGIAIGKTIRLKSFATAVLDGERCASACALAWLGGAPRLMGTSAYVGFHAAYVEKDGRAMEIGVGNALVGSYLTQIGLSENAVIYITAAAPTEVRWLTLRDAEKIGIDVVPWATAPAARPAQPLVAAREMSERDLPNRARSFVNAVTAKWSDANSAGLSWLDALYADQVDYYGKRLSRDAVLTDKRRFTERWPERAYKVISSYAECNASKCFIDGYVDWQTRDIARKATASGVAGFAYVVVPSGGGFLITGENGRVVQRRETSPLQALPGWIPSTRK